MENEKEQGQNIDRDITPELVERKKSNRLFTLTVEFSDGPEYRRHTIINRYSDEVMKIRENIFIYGLVVPVPGKWECMQVIPPLKFEKIYVERQRKYLE